jgi:hypothetical protein
MRSTSTRRLRPPGWTCRRTRPSTHWLLLSLLGCALVVSPVLAQDEGIDEGVTAEPAVETTVPGEAETGPESDATPPAVVPPTWHRPQTHLLGC